ncbi:MAG: hypothetical protein KKD74_06540 [Bacteroidetes bacterium]|nr:hypothetical protein [Bacteroidales bacterium]MBU1009776.1 hypothetical protein [Bacteroidota bacterium]
MRQTRRLFAAVLAITFIAFCAGSCRKFDGDQTIPAYLRIDTISLTTDYFTEGAGTHNITDAWVFVNDQLIGAFELPATFPVLATGVNKVEIRPGIKINGISATRAPYPFYKPYIIEAFNFVEDSVQVLHPTTSYYGTSNFAWLEDFEGSSISLEKTSKSDTTINKTAPANSPEAWLSEYSAYSGKIHLTGDFKKFEVATFNSYVLPGKGAPVFLEMDYKCDRAFGVGLFVKNSNTILTLPLVIMNKTTGWKKIYINLGPTITDYPNAQYIKVYFDSDLGTEATDAQYFIDNLKIVYRNNP